MVSKGRTFTLASALWGGWIWVAGCGSASDTAGPGATGSPTTACDAVSQGRCSKQQQCSITSFNRRYPDLSTCEARESAECVKSLAAPSTAAKPTSVQACATALSGASCSDFLAPGPPAACVPPAGALTSGAACAFNAQCATTYCAVANDAECGSCSALPTAGATCTATLGCGGRGLVCARGVCVAPVGENGACGEEAECLPGLSCVGAVPMLNTQGTCQKAGSTAGARCDPRRQTLPDCDRNLGLYCDRITLSCAAITFVGAGASCDDVGMVCQGGAMCVIPTGLRSGTCVAPASDGAACDTTLGPPCLAPAQCVVTNGGTAGTCKLRDAADCR